MFSRTKTFLGRIAATIGAMGKHTRGYHDLMAKRLQNDWYLNGDDPNQRLRQTFSQLREMSRDLAETNQYAITYLKACPANIIGAEGIRLQSQILTNDGEKDEDTRKLIEDNWADWKLPENCTVAARSHHNDEDRLQERTLAADGEVFIWVFIGHNINSHQFAIRTIEADHIDHDLNMSKVPGSSNVVTMGVEHTTAGKVVAYWVTMDHPGALQSIHHDGRQRVRVPALSEWMGDTITEPAKTGYILHQFDCKRSGQMRGVPDLAAVMDPMRKLVKTEAGHHDQAQLGSYAGWQEVATNSDEEDGGPSTETTSIKPGMILRPGKGRKFEVIQPAAPNSDMPAHGDYTINGMSAALGMASPHLGGNLKGTSFSSGRTGAAVEQDSWRIKQNSTINYRSRPLFNAHLRAQLVYGLLKGFSPGMDEERLRVARWQPRGWGYINPLQDIAALEKALSINVTSPQRAIRDRGGDPDEVLREIAEWAESLDKLGIEPDADDAAKKDADFNRILKLSTFEEIDPLAKEPAAADIAQA